MPTGSEAYWKFNRHAHFLQEKQVELGLHQAAKHCAQCHAQQIAKKDPQDGC
jgi:hypothetical protein